MKTEVSHIRARKESLEQVLAHRTYTTESVKRLFAALEKGKAEEFKPLGVLADYVEVDPQLRKADRRIPPRRARIRRRGELGSRPSAASISSAPNSTAAPHSSCTRAQCDRHGHLPEPAIGPETGIAARLSDSLRLTNGFKDRATDLLPRVSLCFLAEDRAAAQRLSRRIRTCISSCPMASAITATPSPAARRSAPDRSP